MTGIPNRLWLIVLLGAQTFIAGHVVAASEPIWRAWLQKRVLPEEEATTMLRRFVDLQLVPLPLPKTSEEWEEARMALHRRVVSALGLTDLLPPSWDLNVTIKESLRRDGYRIEKLTFESYPGMAVPALLYVPEGVNGHVPGIVSIAGHEYGKGKAAEFLQQRNVNLVRRGCVVLAYDYLDTGERNTGPDPLNGKPYGGGNDHSICSFSFSTRNPTGLEVLDAIRAIDVLVRRPEVDPERIGFTGESGGGNSTYWVAAVDARVKLAVPVSSVTTFDYWIFHDRNWDWHQRPFGIRGHADIGTLLAMHAPHPLLCISSRRGTDDTEFPLEEANKSVAWAEHVYRLEGAEQAIKHVESSTAHGYQEDKRRLLYAAVEEWLKPPWPRRDEELPAQVEMFDELRCGLAAGNRTHFDVFAQWIEPLPLKGRKGDGNELDELRTYLGERLGYPDPPPEIRTEKIGTDSVGNLTAEYWLIQTEPGIRLPAVLIGARDCTGPIVLAPGRDENVIARSLKARERVLAFDVRGTAEIAGGGSRLNNYGWFFGRPLVGMWAFDIRQVARFAVRLANGKASLLRPSNRFGWAALLAAASEPDLVDSGTVTIPFASVRDGFRLQGNSTLADVPGLLERLDVPQLRWLWPKGEVVVRLEK